MIQVHINVDINDTNFVKNAYLILDDAKKELYSYSVAGYNYNRIYLCLAEETENPTTCDIRLSVFETAEIALEIYSKLDQVAIYNAGTVDIVANKVCIKANEAKCILHG